MQNKGRQVGQEDRGKLPSLADKYGTRGFWGDKMMLAIILPQGYLALAIANSSRLWSLASGLVLAQKKCS